jgi:hypothetical protein
LTLYTTPVVYLTLEKLRLGARAWRQRWRKRWTGTVGGEPAEVVT